jgi:glutamine amidotransferase
LFAHNGQIAQFGLIRQVLLSKISPEYFDNILGSTDSELMFHLALTFGLEKDMPSAIAEMVRVVEATAEPIGNYQDIWRPVPENSQVIIHKEKGIDVNAFIPSRNQ